MPSGTLEALVASDRQFFEAGATNERIGPATLSLMRGLTHLAAGCVLHTVDAHRISSPTAWLHEVERHVRTCGGSLVRIYLDERDSPLDGILEERGYSQRTELAYAATGSLPPPLERVAVRRLAPEDDTSWALAAGLHRASGIGSVIHDADPDEWTALVRRKCASRDMDGYLITLDGVPSGSIGALTIGAVLRVKNPLVDRDVRRRAVARSALARLSAIGQERGCRVIGAFVIDGSAGQALFETSGFVEVGAQFEWSRASGTIPANG